MNKCPLCDGPVSGRIMFHKTTAVFIDGDHIPLPGPQIEILKLLAHPFGRRMRLMQLAKFTGRSEVTVKNQISYLRKKTKETSLRIHITGQDFIYLKWEHDRAEPVVMTV